MHHRITQYGFTVGFVGGLYDYPSDPWEHEVDQTDNPKVINSVINGYIHKILSSVHATP